jgi:aspartyl-tRNA(Asn)/glutamyl-tRNA(Gln) amidotransferase subunit C
MPELTAEEVEYYAVLARLELTAAERAKLQTDLNAIMAHVERLQELDVAGVPPTSHAVPMQNVLRADEERPSLSPESFLREAPERRDDFFVVPRIVEG